MSGIIGSIIAHVRSKIPADCDEEGCRVHHSRLCDWGTGYRQTCDRKMCIYHAHRMGPRTDYCPEHYEMWTSIRERRKA